MFFVVNFVMVVLLYVLSGVCLLKENVKNSWLTPYAIIFGQRTFFSIIELVFWEKHEFYLRHYNVIFKDRVLLSRLEHWNCRHCSQKPYVFLPRVLNMPKFWIWQNSENDRVLNLRALHRLLNMPENVLTESFEYILGSKYTRILNIAGFWICKS